MNDDISSSRALVIDSNPTSRSILTGMLREIGVGTLVQTSRVSDARRQLELRTFDVVLCDYHFDGDKYTGQDLLDDLRRSQLLPFSTVFIMVTGEASYAKVAEAAESALDGYLLKPHNATTLAERVQQARHRKTVLRPIFEAIEDENFEEAARLCLQRFHARGKYWLYAARIGAELLLRLEQHDAARQLFEAVIESRALPWARLGVARAHADSGQLTSARSVLESLVNDDPAYADAYDVMGRVQVEQGELAAALGTYRKASAITPMSVSRLQKQGMLAFFLGETEESVKALERSVTLGISSKMFDAQTLVLLALSHFDKRDSRGLQRCHDNLIHLSERRPADMRLRRFCSVVNIFRQMSARQLAQVVVEVKALCSELRSPDFDFEASCNALAALSRVRAAEVQLADEDQWVSTIARRHATSKTTTELLAQSARSWAPHIQWIRQEYAAVMQLAESSMTLSIKGDPGAAVRNLIEHGARTLNQKLIDMARLVLQRHQARIPEAAELGTEIDRLIARYGRPNTPGHLGQAPGARQAGELTMRSGRVQGDAPSATANASTTTLPTSPSDAEPGHPGSPTHGQGTEKPATSAPVPLAAAG